MSASDMPIGLLPRATAVVADRTVTGRLLAATARGLYRSDDGGQTWVNPYRFQLPVTVLFQDDTGLYAFVIGLGLIKRKGSGTEWETLNNLFGAQVLRQLTRTDQGMFGVNQFGRILRSPDGGKTWSRIRRPRTLNAQQKRGKSLFSDNCQVCHGVQGVGETYSVEMLGAKDYLMAPPLDDSTHAWHHTDDQLVRIILEGSQRKSRMAGWKGRLNEQQARDIVSYIKTLWGPRALACQGPKHMQCR